MSVGLETAGIWTEIGDINLLYTFFLTISHHLESDNWGSKYPYLLKKLFFDKLNSEEASYALDEIIDIRQKFKEFRADKIICDKNIKNKVNQYCLKPNAINLSESFYTVNGKNIFDVLNEILEFCKKRGVSVKIISEEDLLKYKSVGIKKVTDLDWGAITVEFYNKEKKSIVHVFNHCLVEEENISRAIRFAAGRIEWFKNSRAAEYSHEVVFDDRGQNVDFKVRKRISEGLKKQTSKVSFVSERR